MGQLMENENSGEIYCALFEEGSNLPAESETESQHDISGEICGLTW